MRLSHSRFDYPDSLVEHRSRLVESLSAISNGLRFAVACHNGAYSPPDHFLAIWHSEPSVIHGLGHSESSCHTFSSAFRATSPVLAFRATIVFHVHWHYTFNLHGFVFTLTSPRYPMLITYSLLLIQIPVPLHMIQSLEFTTRTLIVLLGTLHLSFSCSSDGVVFFGHSLFRSLEWFDRYSFSIWFFESLLETS